MCDIHPVHRQGMDLFILEKHGHTENGECTVL